MKIEEHDEDWVGFAGLVSSLRTRNSRAVGNIEKDLKKRQWGCQHNEDTQCTKIPGRRK